MRLICPNCAAEYEVDASMIPAEGRDVQCSSCGTTWFQRAGGLTGETTPEEAEAAATPEEAPEQVVEEKPVVEADVLEADVLEAPVLETPGDPAAVAPNAAAPTTAAATEPRRKELDPQTRAILREEAEREAARRARRAPIETQTDLGLDAASTSRRRGQPATRAVDAIWAERERAAPAPEPTPIPTLVRRRAEVAAGSRGDLLPDIEQINSTLTATSEANARASAQAHDTRQASRGFRYGFSLILLIAAALIGLYIGAPALAAAMPGFEPQLSVYVDAVNAFRVQLDGWLQDAATALSRMTGNDSAGS